MDIIASYLFIFGTFIIFSGCWGICYCTCCIKKKEYEIII